MPASVDIFEFSSTNGVPSSASKQITPVGEISCLKGWALTRTVDDSTEASCLISFYDGGSGGTVMFQYEAPIDIGTGPSYHRGNPIQYMNVPGLGLQFDSGIYVLAAITPTGVGIVDGFLMHTVYT